MRIATRKKKGQLRIRRFRRIRKVLSHQEKNFRRISMNQNEYDNENQPDPKSDEEIFKENLHNWAFNYNITRRALNDLLKMLNKFGVKFLPLDSRTVLKTPKNIQVLDVANGKMWYNGLEDCFRSTFATLRMVVQLNFNFDGMSPFNSSKKELWPILAAIHSEITLFSDS